MKDLKSLTEKTIQVLDLVLVLGLVLTIIIIGSIIFRVLSHQKPKEYEWYHQKEVGTAQECDKNSMTCQDGGYTFKVDSFRRIK